MNNESIFYVYLYVDPKTDEPKYYGKGHSNRKDYHLYYAKHLDWDARDHHNPHLINWIRQLLRENAEPRISIIQNNLIEACAFELEHTMIIKTGRCNIGTGPLFNLSDGGEGSAGHIWLEEECEAQSLRMQEFYQTEKGISARNQIGKASASRVGLEAGFFGKHHTLETRAQISEKLSGPNNPWYNKERPEHSKAMREHYETPEGEAHREATRQANLGKEISLEHREAISKAQTGRERSPEYCEAKSQTMLAHFAENPVTDETCSKISRGVLASRAKETPEAKAERYRKVSESLKRYNAKRKAEVAI